MIKLHPETSEAIATLINSIEVINDEKNHYIYQVDRETRSDWERCAELDIEYNNLVLKLYDDFGIELPCYQFIDPSDSVMKLEKAFQ